MIEFSWCTTINEYELKKLKWKLFIQFKFLIHPSHMRCECNSNSETKGWKILLLGDLTEWVVTDGFGLGLMRTLTRIKVTIGGVKMKCSPWRRRVCLRTLRPILYVSNWSNHRSPWKRYFHRIAIVKLCPIIWLTLAQQKVKTLSIFFNYSFCSFSTEKHSFSFCDLISDLTSFYSKFDFNIFWRLLSTASHKSHSKCSNDS